MELSSITAKQRPRHPLQLFASTIQVEAASLGDTSYPPLQCSTASPADAHCFSEDVPFVVDMPTGTHLNT